MRWRYFLAPAGFERQMRRPTLRLALLVAAAAAAWIVPAADARIRLDPNPADAGPVLAGPDAVWLEDAGQEGQRLRLLASDGRATRILDRLPGPHPQADYLYVPDLAASSRLVAYARTSQAEEFRDTYTIDAAVVLGTRRGRFSSLFACGPEDPACGCGFGFESSGDALDVDGERVIMPAPDCERLAIVARRGPMRARPVLVPARFVSGARLAGRFAAWSSFRNGLTTVYDWRRRRVLYRVRRGEDFDLRADGSLVVAQGRQILRASRRRPRPRAIAALPRLRYRTVRVAGARLAALGRPQSPGFGPSTLVVSDLSGRRRRLLKPHPEDDVALTAFDGDCLAWSAGSPRPRRRGLYLAQADRRAGSRSACRAVAVLSRRVRIREGTVPVRLRCRVLSGQCRGRMTLTRGGRQLGVRTFSLRAGSVATVPVGVRSHRGRRVRVVVVARDRRGDVSIATGALTVRR